MSDRIPPEATDPVKKLLAMMAQMPGPKMHELDPAPARGLFDRIWPMLDFAEEDVGVARARDITVEGGDGFVPAEVIWPRGVEAGAGAEAEGLPVIVYFHGGGFVIGSKATHGRFARALANAAGAIVVNVFYRLAPEHPFPAPVEDAVAATRWVAREAANLGGDPGKLFVGGDSAGANLATVTALMARGDEGPDIAGQILIYPVTDMAEARPSMEKYGEGLFLERADMRWFGSHYLQGGDATDWRVSPLRADDLSGLPPAFVLIAGLDPLRDEGEAYGAALEAAGVDTRVKIYEGVIHGFACMGSALPEAKDCVADIGRWVGRWVRGRL